MKRLAVILFILLVLSSVGALSYKITSHEINVTADKSGNATVSEKYYLVFDSKQHADEFAKMKNEKLGFDLSKWEEFDPRFKINFGTRSIISNLTIEFGEEPSGKLLYLLEFRYDFDSLAFTRSEVGRRVHFSIKKRPFMDPFVNRSEYVIPAGTTLTFILPPQSQPEGGILTNQNVKVERSPTNARVVIPGSLSSNDFDFGYSFFRPISPSFSIARVVKEFSENTPKETQLAIAFIIGVIGLALYVSRHRIERKVTAFLVKNTDFSIAEEERD